MSTNTLSDQLNFSPDLQAKLRDILNDLKAWVEAALRKHWHESHSLDNATRLESTSGDDTIMGLDAAGRADPKQFERDLMQLQALGVQITRGKGLAAAIALLLTLIPIGGEQPSAHKAVTEVLNLLDDLFAIPSTVDNLEHPFFRNVVERLRKKIPNQ
jgi:hypothetical protein